MLELEAMGLDRAKTELSAQYVDHNLLQIDFKNADDHLFPAFGLREVRDLVQPARQRSEPPGAYGAVRQSRARPCSAPTATPARLGRSGCSRSGPEGWRWRWPWPGTRSMSRCRISWGYRLTGKLPEWVSAKDVILEMLRRHSVTGGIGKIIEYYGPGLENLERHGPPRDRQYGRRARRHHDVFPSDSETRTISEIARARGRLDRNPCRSRARPTTSTTRSTCRHSSR